MNILLTIFMLTIFWLSVVSCISPNCRLGKKTSNGVMIDPTKEMCAYLPFQGPVGKIIAEFKPTKVANATKDHSKLIIYFMKRLVAKLPGVGSYITMAYDVSSIVLAEPKDSVVARVVKELQTTIYSLISYVDTKAQEVEYKRMEQHLTGLLAAGNACSDYDKPDQMVDLERCLISLNTRVVGLVSRFLPSDDSILTYDSILPFFRQYSDLQLTVTQDLLRIAMLLKKNSAAEDYAKRLRDQGKNFYIYANQTIAKTIKIHTAFEQRKCEIKKTFKHFMVRMVYAKCTQETNNGRVCIEEYEAPLSQFSSDTAAYDEAYFYSHKCHASEVEIIKQRLSIDLEKYWNLEVMSTAYDWHAVSKVADKLYNILRI